MPWLTTDQVQNYGLWLQSGAIFLTFVGVIISAGVTRNVARKRAILDMIGDEQTNPYLVATRTKYLKLRLAGHMVQYAKPELVDTDDAATVRSILNRYELIAVGIRNKTLHEKVYREFWRTTLVRDWIALKPYVMERRTLVNSPKAYEAFEALAVSWATKSENC